MAETAAGQQNDVKGFGSFDQDEFEDPSLLFFDETEYVERDFSFNDGYVFNQTL